MGTRHKKLIGIIGLIILVVGVMWWLGGTLSKDASTQGEGRGISGDPVDIATDFYAAWFAAKESTTTNPYAAGLQNSMALSVTMSERLTDAEGDFRDNGNDPVLCQSGVPDRLRTKPIFKIEEKVGVMLLPNKDGGGEVSVATLELRDGQWMITDIACTIGEQAPQEGEYSFVTEGNLLKASLQPPLNTQYWHLVFEQNGTLGYTVPLLLGETSVCILPDGTEEICQDDTFTEAIKVRVQGNMTEAGVDVKRVELLE